MAARILEYHAAIVKAIINAGYKKAVPILTFVLYHGAEEWTSPKSIQELFTNFKAYIKCLETPFLINPTKAPLKTLKGHGEAAYMEILFALQPNHGFMTKMSDIAPILLAKNECCINEGINYITSVDNADPHVIIDKLAKFAGGGEIKQLEMFEVAIRKTELLTARRVKKETTAKVRKETTERVRKEDELRLLMALEKQGLNLKEIEAIMARFKEGK